MNNRKLALVVSRTISTRGGYLYSGANLTGTVPFLRQEIWTCQGSPFVPGKEDLAANKRLLARAPLGAIVGIFTSAQGFQGQETWKKDGPCSWTKVEDWEETWGDWGRSGYDRISGVEDLDTFEEAA